MNEALLNKILACPDLPTMPATAIEVLDLCRREKVPMAQLARTISRDPALAIKVLKTVNSAAYGLRNQVTTISHALVLLGINSVKSLALGFSLVGSLKDMGGVDYDPRPIWQRSLLSAISARSICLKTGNSNHEETFLAGLLQDMGILALIQTIGSPYVDLLKAVGDRQADLWAEERKYLRLDHAQVGEALAESWSLPPILTIPIRYHEEPQIATGEGQRTAYAVALGNKAALPFFAKGKRPSLDDYLDTAADWFGLDSEAATQVLEMTAGAAPQMSALLELGGGPIEDTEAILAEAQELRDNLSPDERKKAS